MIVNSMKNPEELVLKQLTKIAFSEYSNLTQNEFKAMQDIKEKFQDGIPVESKYVLSDSYISISSSTIEDKPFVKVQTQLVNLVYIYLLTAKRSADPGKMMSNETWMEVLKTVQVLLNEKFVTQESIAGWKICIDIASPYDKELENIVKSKLTCI